QEGSDTKRVVGRYRRGTLQGLRKAPRVADRPPSASPDRTRSLLHSCLQPAWPVGAWLLDLSFLCRFDGKPRRKVAQGAWLADHGREADQRLRPQPKQDGRI